jgi:hypothetical protein
MANQHGIDAKIRKGIEELERGEGILEDELDALNAKTSPNIPFCSGPSARTSLSIGPTADPIEIVAVTQGSCDISAFCTGACTRRSFPFG